MKAQDLVLSVTCNGSPSMPLLINDIYIVAL